MGRKDLREAGVQAKPSKTRVSAMDFANQSAQEHARKGVKEAM